MNLITNLAVVKVKVVLNTHHLFPDITSLSGMCTPSVLFIVFAWDEIRILHFYQERIDCIRSKSVRQSTRALEIYGAHRFVRITVFKG